MRALLLLLALCLTAAGQDFTRLLMLEPAGFSLSSAIYDWDASSIVAADGATTAWTDSIQGKVLTSAALPTYEATGFNGQPCVSFNGTTQFLAGTATWPENKTVFMVGEVYFPVATTGFSSPFYLGTWTLASNGIQFSGSAPLTQSHLAVIGAPGPGASTAFVTQPWQNGPRVYGVRYSGGATRFQAGGVTTTDTTTRGFAASGGAVTLGRLSTTTVYQACRIARVLICNEMTDAQFSAGMSYLANRYGLNSPRRSANPDTAYLLAGQSNADGSGGATALTTTQSYTNRFLILQSSGAYIAPANIGWGNIETSAPGFANTRSKLYRDRVASSTARDSIMLKYAQGSQPIASLKKGTTVYNNSLLGFTAAKGLTSPYYTGWECKGVVWIHGESDVSSSTYQADLTLLQSDYETDIKAITGQAGTIPLFCCQPSNFTAQSFAALPANNSYHAMLAAHIAQPGKVVLTNPCYFLPFSTGADGVHRTNVGHRRAGAYMAKAADILESTGTFEPLRPNTITRSGAVVTITFTGRVGSLVLDTTNVSNPGNYGFEWVQTGGVARTISSIALANGNTEVQITLSGDPGTPTTQKVAYANFGTLGVDAGPTTGARGNVRDSDTTVNSFGEQMPNWLVHFNNAVQ